MLNTVFVAWSFHIIVTVFNISLIHHVTNGDNLIITDILIKYINNLQLSIRPDFTFIQAFKNSRGTSTDVNDSDIKI